MRAASATGSFRIFGSVLRNLIWGWIKVSAALRSPTDPMTGMPGVVQARPQSSPSKARLQLLRMSGFPPPSIAPTARTVGMAAGTCRHSQPLLPAAATIRTLCLRQLSMACARTGSGSPDGVSWPPLILITWAPPSTASRICTRQIKLRASQILSWSLVCKDRNDQTSARLGNAFNGAPGLAENDARHTGSVRSGVTNWTADRTSVCSCVSFAPRKQG